MIIGALIFNALATIYMAHRIQALERELLGVYMDLYDRLGMGSQETPPRVVGAMNAWKGPRRP